MRCERLETITPSNGKQVGITRCKEDAEVRIRSAAKITIGNFCRRHASDIRNYRGWTTEPL